MLDINFLVDGLLKKFEGFRRGVRKFRVLGRYSGDFRGIDFLLNGIVMF